MKYKNQKNQQNQQDPKPALDDVEKKLKLNDKNNDNEENKENENNDNIEKTAQACPPIASQADTPDETAQGSASGNTRGEDVESSVWQQRLQRFKQWALTNVGIAVIVLTVVALFLGISLLHHHANSHQVASSAAWQTTVNTVKTPAPTLTPAKSDIATTLQPVMPMVNQPRKTLPTVQVALAKLSEQINTLNQHVEVISQQLIAKAHQKPAVIHQDYHVLGWRLDQNTNQWVADIEFKNQVKAYEAGQRIGPWHVRSVNANGVVIK